MPPNNGITAVTQSGLSFQLTVRARRVDRRRIQPRIPMSLLIVCLFLIPSQGKEKPVPRFEEYPARAGFRGSPAPAIISHPRARLFRTMIKTQAKNQANFAGHYYLAIWGCGSDCRGFALIDARTGRVYFNPRALNVIGVPFHDEDSLQFRRDSRLLIISGSVDGFGGHRDEAKFYYEWRENQFRLLRRTKIKKSNE